MRNLLAVLMIASVVVTGCGSEKSTEQPTPPAQKQAQSANFYASGQYKVGVDISAGEYVAVGTGYVEVTSDGKNILANDNITNARSCITVVDGEYVKITGDVKLYVFGDAPKIDTNGALPSGQYKAGRDIKAGEYKITLEQKGYYDVTRDARHNYIQNQFTNEGGQFYTRVDEGQYLKIRNGTGQFVGEVATPAPAPAPAPAPKPAKVADLGLTFDEFKARYNANIAEIAPETGWDISGTQLQVKDGKSAFMHTFNQNVVMVGTADNATGKLTSVIVTSTPRSEDDGAAALLAYGLVIMTLSPEIDYLGRGELLSTLKLHNEEQIRSLTQSDGLAQRGNVLYRTTYVAGQGMFHFIATVKK